MADYWYEDLWVDDPSELLDELQDIHCETVWPLTVYQTRLVPLGIRADREADFIVAWLVEDRILPRSPWATACNGSSVVEHWLENYYSECSGWYDSPSTEAVLCIEAAALIIQDAIDWWLFWNEGFIRMFAGWRAWNPSRWCIGNTVLEQAVEKAEAQLRGIDLYLVLVPDYSKPEIWEYPGDD